MADSYYQVPREQTQAVLRALSHETRLRILALLRSRPMGITEIARTLKLSQPNVTTYVNQLEELNLIFTRIQKKHNGQVKLCYTIYNGLVLPFEEESAVDSVEEYVSDIPVGHYAEIEIAGAGLLASDTRILASDENSSHFFHPIRVGAQLLMINDGRVRYFLPINIPDHDRLLYVELTVEVNLERVPADTRTDLVLAINKREFRPLTLKHLAPKRDEAAPWCPASVPCSGRVFTWRVDQQRATLNGKLFGDFSLHDLELKGMQPMEVTFRVQPHERPGAGVVFFGEKLGISNRSISLRLVYESQSGASLG